MQDGIKVQGGQIFEINKHANGIRTRRLEFCQFYYYKFKIMLEKFQKLINMEDGIRPCRMDIS